MKISATASALLALILCGPTQALAQAGNGTGTTFLHCVDPTEPTTTMDITLDFARGTANNLAATINATAIDWTFKTPPDNTGTVYVVNNYHLDRTSGALSATHTFYYVAGGLFPGNNNPNTSRYQCTVASAPATKF